MLFPSCCTSDDVSDVDGVVDDVSDDARLWMVPNAVAATGASTAAEGEGGVGSVVVIP